MHRRDTLVTLLALGATAGSIELLSQTVAGDRPFRIGLPTRFSTAGIREGFIAGMQKLGWRERRDFILVETAVPYDPARADEAANRIMDQKPDLLFVFSTAHAVAVRRLTTTLPVVMVVSGYPVESGLANSLARPGKNVTGNSIYAGTGIWGKLLELLRDAKPGIRSVGVLWSYAPPAFPAEEIEPLYREIRQGAAALGQTVKIVEVPTPDRLLAALNTIASDRPDALIVTGGMVRWEGWSTVMQFATDRNLPTISDWEQVPDDKRPRPLLTYAPRGGDLLDQAIAYVDRILKGAKPADLPIQQPSRFDLVVNLKTAKAIGLKMPESILLRAHRVIE